MRFVLKTLATALVPCKARMRTQMPGFTLSNTYRPSASVVVWSGCL